MPSPTQSSAQNPVTAPTAGQVLAQIATPTIIGVYYMVRANAHFQGTVTSAEFDNVYVTTSNSPNLKLLVPTLNNNGQMYPSPPFVVAGDGGFIQVKALVAGGAAATYWCECWATIIDDIEGIVPSA